MQSQEIILAQIDSALAGLSRVRERLADTSMPFEPDLIEYDLQRASSHLEDICHNWQASRTYSAKQHLPSVTLPRALD